MGRIALPNADSGIPKKTKKRGKNTSVRAPKLATHLLPDPIVERMCFRLRNNPVHRKVSSEVRTNAGVECVPLWRAQ